LNVDVQGAETLRQPGGRSCAGAHIGFLPFAARHRSARRRGRTDAVVKRLRVARQK
jgi:hypothetical protein